MVTLEKLAELAGGRLVGDGATVITGVAPITAASEGEITAVTSRAFLRHASSTEASAIVVGEDFPVGDYPGRNLIIAKNPALAFARAAGAFAARPAPRPGVSPLASVADGVSVGEGVAIAPFVSIDRGATIGSNVRLYPFVYVGENAVIGDDTTVYANVTIYDGVVIGRRCTIHGGTVIGSDGFGYVWDGSGHYKIPQIGTVEIGDDVEIGAAVAIDRASMGRTVVGRGSKIDNLVQIAHNVQIGEHCVVVAQVGIAGSSSLGRNVVLAGQVGVADHVSIGSNVRAAGKTGIMTDVPDNSTIAGSPHLPHREWLRMQSHLRKLPELFDRLKKLEEKLLTGGGNG